MWLKSMGIFVRIYLEPFQPYSRRETLTFVKKILLQIKKSMMMPRRTNPDMEGADLNRLQK